MDMTVSRAAAAAATAAAGVGPGLGIVPPAKGPEAESETPPRIQPTKPISFSNGVLKRHAPSQVVYKECLKNHAATLGGHALDGCGEFMPSPTANSADPTSLKCAACGCHRNFHRRDPEDRLVNSNTNATQVIEYQPHHRHHPLPPPPSAVANRAESPPPISSTFAPHMLLALSTGVATANNEGVAPLVANNGGHHHHHHNSNQQQYQQTSRKRFRTKFSQEQKEKMHEFAEKVGWKMQKTNEDLVNSFCNEIGVERGVFKVWMHNNKNTFGKRSTTPTATATAASGSGNNNNNGGLHHPTNTHDDDDNNGDLNGNGNNSNSSISINDQSHHHIHHHHHQQQQHFLNGKSSNVPTNNASSSSS